MTTLNFMYFLDKIQKLRNKKFNLKVSIALDM